MLRNISLLVVCGFFLLGCNLASPQQPIARLPTETPRGGEVTISDGAGDAASVVHIDSHMHLNGIYRENGRQVVDYRTSAANLVALMDAVGVEKVLIMHVASNPGEAKSTPYDDQLAAIKQYPGRLYFMGGGGLLNPIMETTDPANVSPDVERRFREIAEGVLADGSLGFGEMISMHLCLSENHGFIQVLPDHPLFFLLADIAATHDVPIDLHMEAIPESISTPDNLLRACDRNPRSLPATVEPLERLLEHNRQTRIVWQHIGWDNLGYMSADLVRRLLAEHSNLYIALRVEDRSQTVGGGGPMPNRIVDSNGQLLSVWEDLMMDYPDRFMIGSDEFVGIPGKTFEFPTSFRSTWAIIDQLPPDLARAVGSENAARVYRLDAFP